MKSEVLTPPLIHIIKQEQLNILVIAYRESCSGGGHERIGSGEDEGDNKQGVGE